MCLDVPNGSVIMKIYHSTQTMPNFKNPLLKFNGLRAKLHKWFGYTVGLGFTMKYMILWQKSHTVWLQVRHDLPDDTSYPYSPLL